MHGTNPTVESCKRPVTVGVAIRFESPAALERFLAQLATAARQLDRLTEVEVVFCLNGAAERTQEYLEAQTKALDHFDLPFACIESKPGKINAHYAVARARKLQGHLLYVDADVSFEADTFCKLYSALLARPSVQAFCAQVEALPSVAKGWFRAIQDAYYKNRHRLPPRRHLHGRCFLLREWLDAFAASGNVSADDLARSTEPHLSLQKGPAVDDIHYSRVLVHRNGSDAIAQVTDACVRFVPPDSVGELYRDSFRTEFELIRLARLFPEHDAVEKEVFARVPAWKRCLDSVRLAGPMAAAYVTLEATMRAIARYLIVHRKTGPYWQGRGQNHHG